jgi:hypothetical protein
MDNQINQDLKSAMLAGDKKKTEVLKSIKNAIQYETVSLNVKDTGLNEEQAQKVLARESKKRAEAAGIYKNAGATERAEAEIAEKTIIDAYLPKQLDEAAINEAVKDEISKSGATSVADMGRVIGAVRTKLGVAADGATIARLVKQSLEQK